MANYISHSRSNYFQVLDIPKFHDWCNERNLAFQSKERDKTLWMIYPDDSTEASFPDGYYDDDGDLVEIDFHSELAAHLIDENEVAILIEVGYEKLRYFCGFATAIRKTAYGYDELHISLNDIYALIFSEWGLETTDASY